MTDSLSLVDLVLDDVVDAIRLGRSVLVQAAIQGHVDVLRYLLERLNSSSSLTPSSSDQPELSKALSAAFLGAAEQGHSHCLSALLEPRASFPNIDGLVNARDERGDTALMLAAKSGRADRVKTLLQFNPEAQVTAKNEEGSQLPLSQLLLSQRPLSQILLCQLFQRTPGPQVTAAAQEFGNTALIAAAHYGHADCVSQLLQLIPGTQVAAANMWGNTALIAAAYKGHAECVSQLLQHVPGTQVAAANKGGETALMSAASKGHADCISLLLQHSPEAQVAAASRQGRTALMVAAKGGHADCVSLLLQYSPGTQLAAVTRYGNTALMTAALRGHAECVGLLLQHSPRTQVAAANIYGNTALMTAARSGHADCVRQLLQHNPAAQVVAVDDFAKTALVPAVSNNHPDCVALLLAHSPSAQIAAVGGGGPQPVVQPVVEIAARLGHPRCLDLILAHDPQPQHLDAAWLSALRQWDATHALTSPRTQCLERLYAKGALLPASAQEADKAKNRLFIQDFGSRALVADRTNEATMGLALCARGKKRKAGQGE